MTVEPTKKSEMYNLRLKNRINKRIRRSDLDDSELEEKVLRHVYKYLKESGRSSTARAAVGAAIYVFKPVSQHEAGQMADVSPLSVRRCAKDFCDVFDIDYESVKQKRGEPATKEEFIKDISKIAGLTDDDYSEWGIYKSGFRKIRDKLYSEVND